MRGLGPPRFLLQPLAMAASFSPASCPPPTTTVMLREILHPPFKLPSISFHRSPISFSPTKKLFSSSSIVAAAAVASSTSRGPASRPASKQQKQASKIAKKRSSSSKTAHTCPGCGVTMQEKNPNAAGFFIRPCRLTDDEEEEQSFEEDAAATLDEELVIDEDEDADATDDDDDGDDVDGVSDIEIENSKIKGGWTWVKVNPKDDTLAELDVELAEADVNEIEEEFNTEEEWEKSLKAFGPAGPGYGNWNQQGGPPSLQFGRVKKDKNKDRTKREEPEKLVVCVRCHELRNYGKVKDPTKESLLPDFDFERTVGLRLARTHAARTVVVMVVDTADFDGSFPRRVAALLANLEEKQGDSWKDNKSGNVPRLILVANKIDLLPKQISPTRLDSWIRRRVRDGGAPSSSGLFLVSCVKNWGIKAVLECIKKMAGPRGEVWVVGAQNAGKSSLINALAKVEEGAPLTQLTEAPLPGTTLGLVRLGGILPANAKLFDTPGLLHPHQITVRLSREEQKLVQVRKELKPRTYRVTVGDTIHVGGLVRLDVKNISASSMYITVWGSTILTCHFAKTHKADETFQKHVGVKLQPPLTKERIEELGPWVETPITITGDTWEKSSVDIAIAGMGWFGLGIKGTADLNVWTYEGVGITTRRALVPDMAQYFEKAGFTVVKGGTSKPKSNASKSKDFLSLES
eukprot:c19967_g1_i1 orf=71-2137(+)